MSVQINITGEDAGQALQDLATLSAALGSPKGVVAVPEQPEAPKATRTRKPATAKPTEQTAAESEKPDEAEEDFPDTTSDEEVPDDVKLRAAASEAASRAGKAPVKALLDKYGVPNVTALPDDKRVQFLRDLEGLE
ncbi:hypothetical protein [Gorillibacterium timonense]|uniref:hypothetical protein n=1 Tax=Gorillibacterium timonense TaxID=1689269 RepID=UPI00071D8355|nr:hypothetical protein [Gorillibacterium timonense]